MKRVMKDRMILPVIAIALLMGIAFAGPVSAAPPAPTWMPNFPMLAGPQIIIMWAPVPGAAKYNIYMNGGKVAESAAMQYIQPAPAEGGDYKLQVSAVDASGAEGPLSSEKIITIIVIEPPKGFAALPSEDRVHIRWIAARSARIYDLYRRKKGEKAFQLLASVTTTKYQDATLEPGVVYQYAVKSKDLAGKSSGFSEIIDAKLMVERASAIQKKRIPLLSLPAREVHRIEMAGGGFDMAVSGKTAIVSSHHLYYWPNITDVMALDDYEEILPTEGYFKGIAFCGDQFFAVQSRPEHAVLEIDLKQRKVLNRFKIEPPKPGTLLYGEGLSQEKRQNPNAYDLACDVDGSLVISDPDNFRLIRYSQEGEYIETLGLDPGAEKVPEPPWKVDTPKYVQVDQKTGEILVSSIFSVEGFDSDGKRTPSVGTLGSNIGQFSSLYGLQLTEDGKLFAADIRASNIQIFQRNEDGQWEFYWLVSNPEKDGNLPIASPSGIAVSEDGKYLYVLEGIAKRIGVFELLWSKADQRPTQ